MVSGCLWLKDNPCRGCDERSATCHATCEKYKKFREDVDEYNKKKRKFIEARGKKLW